MSVEGGVRAVLSAIDRKIANVAAFRATVTAVDGSLIQIRKEGAVTAGTENYASCTRFLLAVGDVVLCIPLGSKPVVIDVIRRSAAATPGYTIQAAAGTTATASVTGDDTSGLVTLTPGGAGIASGSQIQIDFAVARPSATYNVILQRRDTTTGIVDERVTGLTTARFRIYTPAALTSGTSYSWDYMVRQSGN